MNFKYYYTCSHRSVVNTTHWNGKLSKQIIVYYSYFLERNILFFGCYRLMYTVEVLNTFITPKNFCALFQYFIFTSIAFKRSLHPFFKMVFLKIEGPFIFWLLQTEFSRSSEYLLYIQKQKNWLFVPVHIIFVHIYQYCFSAVSASFFWLK